MQGEVRIIDSAVTRRSPQDVSAYGATPANRPEWHPTATAVEGDVDRADKAGDDLLEYDRFSLLTGRIRWQVDDASGWVVTLSYTLLQRAAVPARPAADEAGA